MSVKRVSQPSVSYIFSVHSSLGVPVQPPTPIDAIGEDSLPQRPDTKEPLHEGFQALTYEKAGSKKVRVIDGADISKGAAQTIDVRL